MARKKPETIIVDAIQAWVSAHNGNVLKLHGNAMQRHSEPDLIGGLIVLGGGGREITLHFAVEVKQPGEMPRKLQIYRLQQWEKVGFKTAVVHSLDEFISRINAWSAGEAVMNYVEPLLKYVERAND